MPLSEHGGMQQATLRKYGFTSLSEIRRYPPKDGRNDVLTDESYYHERYRLMETVKTPLGTIQLVNEHPQRRGEKNLFRFDGGVRQGNENVDVRILLAKVGGQLYGYVQIIDPREDIEPDTGDLNVAVSK